MRHSDGSCRLGAVAAERRLGKSAAAADGTAAGGGTGLRICLWLAHGPALVRQSLRRGGGGILFRHSFVQRPNQRPSAGFVFHDVLFFNGAGAGLSAGHLHRHPGHLAGTSGSANMTEKAQKRCTAKGNASCTPLQAVEKINAHWQFAQIRDYLSLGCQGKESFTRFFSKNRGSRAEPGRAPQSAKSCSSAPGADNQDKKARPAGRKTFLRNPMPASSGHIFYLLCATFPCKILYRHAEAVYSKRQCQPYTAFMINASDPGLRTAFP